MKPLIEHIDELRSRLIYVAYIVLVSFILGVLLSPLIIKGIMLDFALDSVQLVSLTPLEMIYTQIKVGIFFAILVSFPLMLYHVLMFIKPAMKGKERTAIIYFLPSALGLFFIGAYFGYKIFLRVALYFLSNLSETLNIPNLWSVNAFISFIIITSLSIGILFELPLVLLILKLLNIINEKTLSKKRAHIYVLIFILAALFTPPDVITQILIGVPLIVLYELSYFVMKFV